MERWNATQAVTRCEVGEWRGQAWRAHSPKYSPVDSGGSRRKSGRYHRAPDLFPDGPTWTVLYLSLGRDICLGEIIRNVRALPLKTYRITRLRIELQAVLDCKDVARLGLRLEDLVTSISYEVPQNLAAAAVDLGVEGMLVPSATLLGDNLIVFIDQLHPGSLIQPLDSMEPSLTKVSTGPDDS